MADYDLNIKKGSPFDTIGKRPYMRVVGIEANYLKNSLEGTLFDDVGVLGFTPNFNLYTTFASSTSLIVNFSIDGGLVTYYVPSHGLETGDFISIYNIGIISLVNYKALNGVFRVYSTDDAGDYFSVRHSVFSDVGVTTCGGAYFIKTTSTSPVLNVYDSRSSGAGHSYFSFLATPKLLRDFVDGYRIIPSDLYIRFKINSAAGTGGLHPDLFKVTKNLEAVKPIIWAWFFGGVTKTNSTDRSLNNMFDLAFNSYAMVLRPSGNGTDLEFALLNFQFGSITSGISGTWYETFIDSQFIKRYQQDLGDDDLKALSTDLGYLVCTNPDLIKAVNDAAYSGGARITEIAKSSSFLYDSSLPFEMNLKFSVRKHLLSDSVTENSYFVQLAKNDSYSDFGDQFRYSSVMHGFIEKPTWNNLSVRIGPGPPGATPAPSDDYNMNIALPMMYFKFVNLNPSGFGTDLSSKLTVDGLLYRQIWSDESIELKNLY
mgnify:CR=1 FL=1